MIKIFIPVLLISLAVACTPARVALDHSQWNNKEELPVKGRQGILINQKLGFGNYRTLSVKRSWTKGSSVFAGWAWGRPGYEDYARVIGTEYSNRKQTIRFELTDAAANESSVFCVTKARDRDFTIGKNPNSLLNILLDIAGTGDASDNMFWVKLFLKNQPEPWEMVIDNLAAQRNSKSYTGVVARSREDYYTIHPIFKIAGKNDRAYTMPVGSVGYEIRNKQGQPKAAVSLIDKGVVYFTGCPEEEKFLVANICAALLLQEVI